MVRIHGVKMLELKEIAARLDNDERLRLTYRVHAIGRREIEWEVRTDRLLDVAEDTGVFYVDRSGVPVWVKLDEVIEVLAE